ncbi:MAG TPA: hypothetical protein VEZ90_17075, partial [Blastocatellia bacterium]|nr:hypothetical protein [Blastocatellia bacterium]
MNSKSIGAIGAMILALGQYVRAADLSPDKWPAAERTRFEAMEGRFGPENARTIDGRSGLVAATMSPVAVNAGIEALKQGGTAADAAAT